MVDHRVYQPLASAYCFFCLLLCRDVGEERHNAADLALAPG